MKPSTQVTSAGKDAPDGSQIHVTVGGPEADITAMNNRAIQAALDYVAGLGGGTVELTEGEFPISDAVYLRNNVILRGQGEKTVLKKCDALRTRLRFDADMHETSVTVEDPSGFEVGMGVSIGDEAHAVAHLISVRTIIWKSDATLGFNRHLETTQKTRNGAFAQITFPVIYALDVENVAVENLVVDGNSANNPIIEGWADGGIYLLRAKNGRVVNCRVCDVNADGISLNASDDISIEGCVVHDTARLGIHSGGGSQHTVVRNCQIFSNGRVGIADGSNRDGLYLCFSAQHGVYEGNEIYENMGAGISIGHKDGDNLFVDNVVHHNTHGVFFRGDTYRTFNNIFRRCVIEDNGTEKGGYGVYIAGDAHGTVLEECTIRDTRPEGKNCQRVGLHIDPSNENIKVTNCTIGGQIEGPVAAAVS